MGVGVAVHFFLNLHVLVLSRALLSMHDLRQTWNIGDAAAARRAGLIVCKVQSRISKKGSEFYIHFLQPLQSAPILARHRDDDVQELEPIGEVGENEKDGDGGETSVCGGYGR